MPDDPRATQNHGKTGRATENNGVGSFPRVAKPNYDRFAVVEYARKYWQRVCSDSFIACKNRPKTGFYEKVPLGTVFERRIDGGERAKLPDGSEIDGFYLDDCTHFISCCIGNPPPRGERAGGLHIPQEPILGTPGYVPYGIIGVPTL
jgi:hypothetical protein